MERHALRLAKTAAERTGVSLSSLVNTALERHLGEVLAALERRRAAEEVIATFPAELLPSAREEQALLRLWSKAGSIPTEAEIEAAFASPTKHRRARKARGAARAR